MLVLNNSWRVWSDDVGRLAEAAYRGFSSALQYKYLLCVPPTLAPRVAVIRFSWWMTIGPSHALPGRKRDPQLRSRLFMTLLHCFHFKRNKSNLYLQGCFAIQVYLRKVDSQVRFQFVCLVFLASPSCCSIPGGRTTRQKQRYIATQHVKHITCSATRKVTIMYIHMYVAHLSPDLLGPLHTRFDAGRLYSKCKVVPSRGQRVSGCCNR